MIYLCFIARHVNKFSTTSLKNRGLLLETILSGVPNQVNIHSYKNHVIYYFGENFKARIFANFVMKFMAAIMNGCLLIIIGNGLIKSTPHFLKGPKGDMGCKGPFIINPCAST
jgi:hypothetical protein